MLKLLLIFLIPVILPYVSAALNNFCDLENCQGREHLDCTMANVEFGDACNNAVMLNLAPAQAAILDKINSLRNRVAGGLLQNKFAATRMGTMRWNVTLANMGRKNCKKCTFEPDACVNTPDYDFVGQNIGRSVNPKSDNRTNLQIIMSIIDTWFSEHTDAKMLDIRGFPEPTADGPVIANFAQLVRDYSTRCGCGALTYNEGNNKVLLFTCHFDLTNVLGWPVYDDGPVGKKCKTGRNSKYPYLCSESEQYNVNTFWEDNHYGS